MVLSSRGTHACGNRSDSQVHQPYHGEHCSASDTTVQASKKALLPSGLLGQAVNQQHVAAVRGRVTDQCGFQV